MRGRAAQMAFPLLAMAIGVAIIVRTISLGVGENTSWATSIWA